MNKIFKVIWSHATQTFVVVSELTRSKSKAKASVSDVKKNGASSLVTSGFKLSAISALLISTIPTAYAAVAINSTQGSSINTNGAQAIGESIAIGSNAGTQQSDGYISAQTDEARRNAYHLQNVGNARANNTISLGTNAYAGGADSVAIGTRSQAVHNEQLANMSYNSRNSYNAGAVAVGFQSIARGDQTVALGSRAAAYNRQATAIGNDSYAMGVGSVVIGGDDSGYAYESINGNNKRPWANNEGNLGYTNLATGFNPSNEPNKADYRPSAASGNGATVVGVHSQALSKGSTALGVAATAGDGGKTSSTIKDGQIVGIDSTQNIEATAIGALAHARDRNTTAVGHAAKAYSDYSTSIGDDAVAEGKNSSAVGKSSYAKGNYSVAIGNAEDTTNTDRVNATKVIANGLRAIAIGTTARTNADDAIAFGTRTESTVGGAISIGYEAKSKALDAIAIGSGTEVASDKAEGSIAIGNRAGKQGVNAYSSTDKVDVNSTGYKQLIFDKNLGGAQQDRIEMGTNAYAYGHDSIAIGTRAQAVFNTSTDGTSRNSLNSGAVAIGYQAVSKGDQSISLGSRAEALNRQAMALGNDAFASGAGAIVIGGDDSLPNGSTEVGYQLSTGFASGNKYRQSAATGNGAVVVGVHGQALSQGSTAIGVAATAGDNGEVKTKDNVTVATDAKEATAVGAKSLAQKIHTTAVGYSAAATGENSTTVGAESKAKSDYSLAAGYNSTAEGNHSAALGSSAETKGENAIAIGTSAKSLANNTISIGSKANTSIEGAVALGANSESNRQLNAAETTNPYVPATANQSESDAIKATVATTGAVSVGKDGVRRQITNLAAGTADTDAVNVAQLKTAVDTWNVQENGNQKKVINNRDNVNFANGTGTTATVEVDSVGKSATVKYSVNQSGLNVATDGKVTAVTNGNNFATAEQVADAINKSEKTTVVNGNTDITATPKVNGTVTTYDLALSEKTVNDIKQGTTALQEIETTADGVKAQTIKKDSNKANFTSGKNIKLTPSDKGIEVATKDDVGFTTVNATTVNGDTIKSGNVVINKDGINAGNQKITNVAKGTEDSDAVNYSQLKEYVGNNSSYTWNISDNAEGTNSATVSNKDTVAVQGSVKKDESTTKSGIVTKLDGKNITVDLSEKSKNDIADGKKHSSVKGDANVVVTQTTTNTEGGKQFDVKLADTVVVGQGDNSVTIDGTSGTVSGLNNLTWDPNATYEGGKAATQEQLKLVSDEVQKGWNVQTNNDTATKSSTG
ncbi:ESPR-type extended signal peptide-containing protein [Actinobacillus pleuropneumoniae]|uniref:ESPR-type extended signal peptide-containing protein n=1 Tax=Actinobacillus pleuropneumoniae TaxID=715 RepID=UPI00351726BF